MYAIASTASDTAGTTAVVCFASQRYTRNQASYVARLRHMRVRSVESPV